MNFTTDFDTAKAALAYVPQPTCHDDLVPIAFALKGIDGAEALFMEWGKDRKDAKSTWKSAKPNGKVTLGTLIHKAKQYGFNPKEFHKTHTYIPPSPEQIAQRNQAQAKVAKEQEQRQAKGAIEVRRIWDQAAPAPADHPYLVRKGIQAHVARVHNGNLVIPMFDANKELVGLQLIGGIKRFLSGSKHSGSYCILGDLENATEACVPEGFSTGATLHECLGLPVVIAFSASNLPQVAKTIKDQYPGIKIIICADDDWEIKGNPGLTKAHEAARLINALVAIPDFTGLERGVKDTDFNDLARLRGVEAVLECISKAIESPAPVVNDPIPLPPKAANEALEQNNATIDDSNSEQEENALSYYIKTYAPKNKIFEFNNWTYLGFHNNGVPKVKLLLDCSIKLLHSIVDDSQADRQRMEHVIELYSRREGKGRIRLDAIELSRLDAFKIAVQNQRQIFYGSADDLNRLDSHLFNQQPTPPKIRSLSVIGYDAKSNGFYYPRFIYNAKGERIAANGDGYFNDTNVKPFADFTDAIVQRVEPLDLQELIKKLNGAYGNKGLLALGFYVSSAFSHLLFDHYGFFPFLSLYGDPHAGKSFLAKLLNRCFFIDSEGITMTSANTTKGELRKISQRSSMVVPLLEGRKDKSRFDYDGVLSWYNRNSLYSRATTSQDNRTHDLQLQATIAFVWNHECFALKPAKERVISLRFRDTDINEATGEAWECLSSYSPEQLASLGHHVLSHRIEFEKHLVKTAQTCATQLREAGVMVMRVAENHAIALAGAMLALDSVGAEIDYLGLTRYAIECALTKVDSARTESPIADYFFESIAGFNSTEGVLEKDGELLIHLPTALKHLQENSNGFANKKELIQELQGHDRFIVVKPSRAFGKLDKCYHFKIEENSGNP